MRAPSCLPAPSTSPPTFTPWQAAGGFGDAEVVKGVPLPDGAQSPLEALQSWAYNLLSWGGGSSSDPFFAVVARRLDD